MCSSQRESDGKSRRVSRISNSRVNSSRLRVPNRAVSDQILSGADEMS